MIYGKFEDHLFIYFVINLAYPYWFDSPLDLFLRVIQKLHLLVLHLPFLHRFWTTAFRILTICTAFESLAHQSLRRKSDCICFKSKGFRTCKSFYLWVCFKEVETKGLWLVYNIIRKYLNVCSNKVGTILAMRGQFVSKQGLVLT